LYVAVDVDITSCSGIKSVPKVPVVSSQAISIFAAMSVSRQADMKDLIFTVIYLFKVPMHLSFLNSSASARVSFIVLLQQSDRK
jgi:hypothetical protein